MHHFARSALPPACAALAIAFAATYAAGLAWHRDDPYPSQLQPAQNVEPASGMTAAKAPPYGAAPASAQPFTADDGGLIVNPGLLETIEFFLVAHPDQGIAGLDAFLATRLTAAARRDAMRIGASYRAYMLAYDGTLAAQNLHVRGTPAAELDLARLVSWAQQRRRLRQAAFGIEVARQWFDNDDARLEQAIDALRQGPAQAAPDAPGHGPDPRYAPSPAMLRDEAAQRMLYLRRVLDEATTGFRERLGR